MSQLIEIQNDLFDIASRLKSIDPNYRVMYNTQTEHFEVHDVSRRPNTLSLVVPYDELDSRTVSLTLFTRVQRAEKLLRDIEKHNEKVERQRMYDLKQNLLSKMEKLCF